MDYVMGNKDDLEGILKLLEQLVENRGTTINFNYAIKIWNYIETKNIKYMLAKENNDIIGLCYLCIIPNLTHNGKSLGYIGHLIVDKNYRQKGIGKKLMQKAIEYSKQSNCYKVIIQSGIEREGAHKFYEKLGFDGKSKKAYELKLE
ncbi:MAG: GNAT family N-acetyltransferase [Treponema sp.]|nr:GNAT family N-acetyltransferase [Treponema sp.]